MFSPDLMYSKKGYETLPQPPESRHDSSPTPNDETDQNPPDDRKYLSCIYGGS